VRQQAWLRRSLLKLWSTVNEAEEYWLRPFRDSFAAGIEAKQWKPEALLDWCKELMDS